MAQRKSCRVQHMKTLRFGSSQRALLIAFLFVLAFSAAGVAAGEREEIEFARSVVKAKLETERTSSKLDWTNPDSGKSGTMQIVETQILDRGLACRWYEWSLESDDDTTIKVNGKGCRLANGEWLLEETAVVNKTVRVKETVEVERPVPAPEPKDPMAEVTFTRPDSMAGKVPGENGADAGRKAEGN